MTYGPVHYFVLLVKCKYLLPSAQEMTLLNFICVEQQSSEMLEIPKDAHLYVVCLW